MAVGVAAGFCAVVEDRLGPLQIYVLALPAGFAVSVMALPLQLGPLFEGDAVGAAITDTVVV